MNHFEVIQPMAMIGLIPIIILWLIPKKFNVDMAAGRLFKDLTRFRPVSKEICDTVSEFKEIYDKDYYKDLAIFSVFYLVFVFLLTAFICFVIFQKG